MQKVFIIFIIFGLSISNAQIINETKTDIYFGNGVWNTQFSEDSCIDDIAAECSQSVLNDLIKEEIIKGDLSLQKKYGQVKLQYNWGQGYMMDVLETYYQLILAGQVNAWQFFQVVSQLSNNIYTGAGSLLLYKAFEPLIVSSEAGNVNEMWQNYYEKSFKLSHRVLLVSHSQGNMFANRIYRDAMSPIEYREYFANLQIATPASKVEATMGTHVTISGDPILLIPNCLNANADGSGHTFLEAYLGQADPLYKIIDKTKALLGQLDTTVSQWKTKNEFEIGTCDYKIEVEHFFDSTVNSLLNGEQVYPFAPTEKLYQVDENGTLKWVKASDGGQQIVNIEKQGVIFDPNGNDIGCYQLTGTKDEIVKDSCADLNATNGIITVDLLWQSKELDLDLTITGPTEGVYENQDGKCPTEHFYIKDESGIEAGTYQIVIAQKGLVKEEMVPQDVYVLIQAKGKMETLHIPVESIAGFDIGHIADIEVGETKTVSTAIQSTTSSGGYIQLLPKPVYGSVDPYTGKVVYIKYVYEIIPLINQVMFGPVRGAYLQLHSIGNYIAGWPALFTGSTSTGSDLHTAGIINIPHTLVNQLNDNTLYLLSAEGGEDIDADDDGQIDAIPTQNYGTLHAVMSGKTIKDGGYKVNVLTELVYQVTKDMFDVNTSEEISARIDAIVPRLIANNVNGDSVIDSTDLVKWLPTLDKAKLAVDYDTVLAPIVSKLFNGEDVFQDAYKLLYYPVADAGEDRHIGVAPLLTLDGSKSYDINGQIVQYQWMEGDTVLCNSKESVCEIEMLSIGKHYIDLNITDNDGEVRSDKVFIWIDAFAPTANAGLDQIITEVGTITLDGSNSFDSNGNIVEYLWTKDGTTYCQGPEPICVVENLAVGDYTFVLKVTDNDGVMHSDVMQVTYPYKPVADAGSDISINFGQNLVLDGSKSYDSDGYIVEYVWRKGSQVYCSANTPLCTIEGLTVGAYTFELRVKDDNGAIDSASINVNVLNAEVSVIGAYNTSGHAYDLAVSEDSTKMYVADGNTGLQILDISDPTAPSLLGSYALNAAYSITLSASGTVAYVANCLYGVQIIDVSNPTAPFLMASYNTSGCAVGVTLSADETIAYVADGPNRLEIVNISNPAAPSLVRHYFMPGEIKQLVLSADNTLAYVAAGSVGLQIIDISNPMMPSLSGSLYTFAGAYSVTLSTSEDVAYVAAGQGGLQIIDTSNAAVPALLGSYKTPDSVLDVVLSENGAIAYIADFSHGLKVIDISDPAVPILRGNYDTPGDARKLVLSADGNIIYVADGTSGIQIIDVSMY